MRSKEEEEDNPTAIFPNFFVSAADGRTDLATALVGGLFLGRGF